MPKRTSPVEFAVPGALWGAATVTATGSVFAGALVAVGLAIACAALLDWAFTEADERETNE